MKKIPFWVIVLLIIAFRIQCYAQTDNAKTLPNDARRIGNIFTYKENGLYVLVDSTNRLLTDEKYSAIHTACDGDQDLQSHEDERAKKLYLIVKDSLTGLIDGNGRQLLPVKYSKFNDNIGDSILTFIDTAGYHTFFNKVNHQVVNPYQPFTLKSKYRKDNTSAAEYFVFDNYDYWLVDSTHRTVTKRFYEIFPFKGGKALLSSPEEVGYIDKQGNYVKLFDSTIAFNQYNCYILETGSETEKFGFMDSTLSVVIKPQYSNIFIANQYKPYTDSYFCNKLIAAKDNKYGMIDNHNNVIIPFVYDNLEVVGFSDLLIAKKGKYKGFISTNKAVKNSFVYDDIEPRYEATYECSSGGYVYRFEHGSFDVTAWDDFGRADSLALFIATKNGEKYILDPKGKELAKGNYVGNNKIEYGGKFGLLFPNVVIEPKYSEIYASGLINKYYIVKKDSLTGLYSDKGKLVVPVKYESVEPKYYFETDSTVYELVMLRSFDGSYNILRTNGKLMLPKGCCSLIYHHEGSCSFCVMDKNGKYGLYSMEGKRILPFEYDELSYEGNKTYKAKKDGKIIEVKVK